MTEPVVLDGNLASNADPNRLPCGVCHRIISDHSEADIEHCHGAIAARHRCTECLAELLPVWPEYPVGNLDGVLRLTAHGGYGEYTDPLFLITIDLCNTCADKLCELFPNVKQVLDHHL